MIRIFLTILLGIWTAALPGFRVAGAADTPPQHPNTATPIITDTAVPASLHQLSIQPYWSLNTEAGNLSRNWRRVSAGGNFRSLEIPVKITYGLIENMEVYTQFGFIHNWADGVSNSGGLGNSAAFSGMGDTSITFKYQILQESTYCPTVSPIFTTLFPTGHHYNINPARLGMDVLGDGAYVFTTGFNLSKWVGPVYLYANLWYNVANKYPRSTPNQTSNPLQLPVLSQDQITWNLAAEIPITGPWVALMEYYSSWGVMGSVFGQPRQPSSITMGVLPGIEYIYNSQWCGVLGVAIDLAGKSSLYGYTPILTVIFTY